MDRLQILKAKHLDGLYAILDSHTQTILATADTIREATQTKKDIERMWLEDQILSEAMKKIGLE